MFSYWDGSGHRKTTRMKKGLPSFSVFFSFRFMSSWILIFFFLFWYESGNTIYQFLQRCLESLRKDFHELKTISADQLMYVKEDLIIPHHYSFYDFIVTKVLIVGLKFNLIKKV